MYKLTDLIDKIIKVEELGAELFIKESEGIKGHEKLKVLAKVLAAQERKHIKLYEKFKESILNYEDIEDIDVEVDIYDKASKLVYEFMHFNTYKEIYDVKDLFELGLSFANDTLALIKRVRGLFVSAPSDMETNNYKLLTAIIKQEEKFIIDLESILKNF